MGSGFSVDLAGGSSPSHVLLQEQCSSIDGEDKGLRTVVPATMGHSGLGFWE